MGISVQELKTYGEMHRKHIPDSTNNCGRINSLLTTDLKAEGVKHEFIQTQRIQNPKTGDYALHHFIKIDAGEVYRETSGGKPRYITEPVIMDAAVDQFNKQNAEDESVDVSLSLGGARTADDLPTVGIFTPNDVEYAWYSV